MDDEHSDSLQEAPSTEAALDLSILQSLDFGPDWGSEKPSPKPREKPFRKGASRERGFKKASSSRKNIGREPRARGKIAKTTQSATPEHEITFAPEEVPFTRLIRQMKTSCLTYPLFDLAKVILEKSERFVVLAKPVEKPNEETSVYFVTKPGGVPFVTHEAACDYLMGQQDLYDIEEREADAPKGSFSVVKKCGITGELLAPPNYHRFGELIREHHATRLANVPFEKFHARMETDQDPEAVATWLESMKKVRVYRLKDRAGDEPDTFDSLDLLRRFLVEHRFPKLIKSIAKTRIPGTLLAEMPSGILKRDMEQALDEQRRYPLTTANLLRSRFRRMNFTVYKRGPKGITYVCAVKRRLRTADTVFAESIQSLLSFLDKNPKIRKNELVERHLEFEQKARTEDQENAIRQLAKDLRWVVTEGYVTEFADGLLQLAPLGDKEKIPGSKGKGRPRKPRVSKGTPGTEVRLKEEATDSSDDSDTESLEPARASKKNAQVEKSSGNGSS